MSKLCLIFAFTLCCGVKVLSHSTPSDAHVWTGYVTDTHCGTHCQVTSHMKPDLHCVRLCVKRGSKYGLWSGKRVYVLEPQAKAAALAAQEVRVTGRIEGNTIYMRVIEPTSGVGARARRP